MSFLDFIKVVFIGIVQGITEWLPVSSTGHMILVNEFIKLKMTSEFLDLFFVVIQLGSIMAVVTLYFNKLNPLTKKKTLLERKDTWNLWGKVLVATVPAGILGLLLDDIITKYLYSYITVAITLIIYGIAFIVIEHKKKDQLPKIDNLNSITYKTAVLIGLFQMLALIPGTSRSGATIVGALLLGLSRPIAAEFSFFMAVPVMLGASLYKILKYIVKVGVVASGAEIAMLIVGMVVAYLVSLLVIKFLMNFVQKHTFRDFGIYRIVLGVIVIIYFVIKTCIAA